MREHALNLRELPSFERAGLLAMRVEKGQENDMSAL